MKNILDYLNPNRNANKQAKLIERVSAITHTSDAIGWRPVSYEMPQRFQSFIADDSDKGLLSKTNADMFNPRYYEGIVDAETAIGKREVSPQEIDHKRVIHQIRIYQKASLLNIQQQIARLEDELARSETMTTELKEEETDD